MESKGTNGVHEPTFRSHPKQPYLEHTPKEELHDLICVGFGPASLAIAIALHDRLEGTNKNSGCADVTEKAPRVTFLERQDHFAWHSGMLIGGAKMQITFIKDMATLRNPRSQFTFVNYLHEHGRLVEFTNLDTFLPQRVEFENYLKWCASSFNDIVSYCEEVVDVKPYELEARDELPVTSWSVTTKDTRTGHISTRRTRNVVVAAGGQPSYPASFRKHPRVIHSSQYVHNISSLLPDRDRRYDIAVIGSGQSAAEIFDDLHSRYPKAKTNLLIRGTALRPSDDSPFVNEIFHPSRVTSFYSEPESWRRESNEENSGTNYGVVRLGLLERIYETLYIQRLYYGNNESAWPHRIIPNASVTALFPPSSPSKVKLRATTRSPGFQHPPSNGDCFQSPAESREDDDQEFDAVILGTGYKRDAYKSLLYPLQSLRADSVDDGSGDWKVRRDYSIEFADGKVAPGCGIWLQGCCENSHGLADTLLSILAVRGGEIVDSIFAQSLTANGANHSKVVNGS